MITITLNKKVYTIPDGWKDITIGQFQKINTLLKDEKMDEITKNLELVCILSGIDLEELLEIKQTEYFNICNLLTFIQDQVEQKRVDEWTHNKIKYKFDHDITNYNVAQFFDIDHLSRDNDSNNLHLLMAIFFREVDKKGNIKTYTQDGLKDRAEIFKEHMPIDITYTAQLFFYLLNEYCLSLMKTSSPETQS